MTDKQKKTGHMQGKRCGYEKMADGSIKIAPVYASRFDEIHDQRVAVHNTLAAVTKECSSLNKISEKQSRETWADVLDDYGLDKNWEYIGDGVIRPVKNEGDAT